MQSKPEEGAHLRDVTDEMGVEEGGKEGVDCEGSAENYGRSQFRSNQREIWGGLGWRLIGAGTRLCIHLSMRGLHRQSSPSWPNKSHSHLCYLHYPQRQFFLHTQDFTPSHLNNNKISKSVNVQVLYRSLKIRSLNSVRVGVVFRPKCRYKTERSKQKKPLLDRRMGKQVNRKALLLKAKTEFKATGVIFSGKLRSRVSKARVCSEEHRFWEPGQKLMWVTNLKTGDDLSRSENKLQGSKHNDP